MPRELLISPARLPREFVMMRLLTSFGNTSTIAEKVWVQEAELSRIRMVPVRFEVESITRDFQSSPECHYRLIQYIYVKCNHWYNSGIFFKLARPSFTHKNSIMVIVLVRMSLHVSRILYLKTSECLSLLIYIKA